MQNSRRLIASLVGGVLVCLVVAALSSPLILQANLRSEGVAHLVATSTPTLAPTDTPAPTVTALPTDTPTTGPVVLLLDSASGGSMVDQPGEFQYSASLS